VGSTTESSGLANVQDPQEIFVSARLQVAGAGPDRGLVGEAEGAPVHRHEVPGAEETRGFHRVLRAQTMARSSIS
jgi:hypothetical protein